MNAKSLKLRHITTVTFILFLFSFTAFTAPIKILRIGDSITAGYTHGSWFKNEMAKAGIEWVAQGTQPSWYWEDDYNWNEGWGGCTIQWFKNYQTTYTIFGKTQTLNCVPIVRILNQYQPDIILLMLGTNNTGGDDEPDGRFLGGYDSLYIEYSALLDSIDRLGPATMHVIMSTIPLAQPQLTKRNDRIKKFNELVVRRLVKERTSIGKKYSLVEAESAIDNTTDLEDHVHPNVSGVTHFAEMWVAGIKKVINGTVAIRIPVLKSDITKNYNKKSKLVLPFSKNFIINGEKIDVLGRTAVKRNGIVSNKIMIQAKINK